MLTKKKKMMNNYVKKYTDQFNLYKSEDNLYCDLQGRYVLSVTNNKIYYLSSSNVWQECKPGDLIVSIINNIPIHEV